MSHRPLSHLIASQAHWDAMADAIGEESTANLYGARPEAYVAPGGFADKAPGRAVIVVICLTLVLACSVAYRATHRAERPDTVIHPCALVLTRNGQECR